MILSGSSMPVAPMRHRGRIGAASAGGARVASIPVMCGAGPGGRPFGRVAVPSAGVQDEIVGQNGTARPGWGAVAPSGAPVESTASARGLRGWGTAQALCPGAARSRRGGWRRSGPNRGPHGATAAAWGSPLPLPRIPACVTCRPSTAPSLHDYGCRRCQVCRATNADRHRKPAPPPVEPASRKQPGIEHGTKSMNMNHGCRCERCSQGIDEANRRPPKQGHARQLTPADECATVSGYFRVLRARRYTLA